MNYNWNLYMSGAFSRVTDEKVGNLTNWDPTSNPCGSQMKWREWETALHSQWREEPRNRGWRTSRKIKNWWPWKQDGPNNQEQVFIEPAITRLFVSVSPRPKTWSLYWNGILQPLCTSKRLSAVQIFLARLARLIESKDEWCLDPNNTTCLFNVGSVSLCERVAESHGRSAVKNAFATKVALVSSISQDFDSAASQTFPPSGSSSRCFPAS